MLDLPLRPGDSQSELPFGPDRLRSDGPESPPPRVPPSPRQRPRRPRHRKLWLWIALAFIVLLTVAWLVFWPKPPEPAFSADPFVLERVRVGQSGEVQTLTVTNVGERLLAIEMLAIVGENADEFRLEEDGCGARILEPQVSCAILLRFSPSAMGARSAILELHGEMPESPASLALGGEGTAPRLAVSPSGGSFGPVDVGSNSSPLDLLVGNEGTAPLEIRRVALGGVAERDFRLTRNDCSKTSLAPGETCPLRLVFVPRAAGVRQAQVVLDTDTLPPAPQIELRGEGVWTGAAFAVEPDALDFGRHLVAADGASRRIQVTNRQSTTLSGLRVGLSDVDRGFAIGRQSCRGARLEPGESCQITVVFAPAEEGDSDSLLEISQPDVGRLGIELKGSGVAPRWVLAAPDLAFGEVRVGQAGESQTVELQNEGSAGGDVQGVELTGPDAGGFRIARDQCSGRQVEPQSACTLEIAFEPQREGEHRAVFELQVGAGRPPGRQDLAGRAVAPRLSLDREMVSFDRVHRTTAQQVELNLANRGTAGLRLGPFSVEDDPEGGFRLAGGSCGASPTLPAGTSCTVTVVFAPTVEGRSTARLRIEHDGISGPREVPLAGIGLPPPIPKIILEEARIDFGPQPLGSRSSIQTLNLRAAGTGLLELREFTLEGPDAGDFRIVPATCHAGPSLQPGTACAIGLRFTPSAAGGRSAVLVLRHNAATGRDEVRLQGEGIGGPPE